MEMGDVPKRQQPDHRADNSRRSPTGLQCIEKFPHPEASFTKHYLYMNYIFMDNSDNFTIYY